MQTWVDVFSKKSAFAQNQLEQRFLPFTQLARIFDAMEGLLTLQSFMGAAGVFLLLPRYVEFCQQDYFKCILTLDSFSKTVLAVIIFNQFAWLATK